MTKFSTRCVIAFVTLFLLICFAIQLLRDLHLTENNNIEKTTHGKLPSALIVGVRKGGTRALLDAIGLHPKVRIVRRETHFFDSNYSLGIDWYMNQMPQNTMDDEVVIEKTPAYFTSENAPRRVYQLNPNMKLILIVRHPVFRTISDFTQVYYNKMEQNKTLPILSIEAFKTSDRGQEQINMEYKPITNSLYDIHISRWLSYFPLENFLFVNGDVFRANPLHELRKVELFLGLEREITASQLVFDYNKGFFCFRKTSKIRCLGESKGRKHRAISENVVEKLGKSFEDHNQNFFRLINRTFTWE